MKKIIEKNFAGLGYVTVEFEAFKESKEHGLLIHSEQLRTAEMMVALRIVKDGYPIRSKELKVLRSACNLTSRKLASMLRVSHVSILNWEKKYETEEVPPVELNAVLSVFGEIMKVEARRSFLNPTEHTAKPFTIRVKAA
jgi:DNA-binding transcriptional regulator YiaG